MPDLAAADPAMLQWVARLEAELAGIDTVLGLFVAIDRTRGTMDWMRQYEPDTAARVDAAIRAAHGRLQNPAASGTIALTNPADVRIMRT